MALFNKLTDRTKTQLAYRVKYWPWCQLSPAARELVKYKKNTYLTKQDILNNCNETQEVLWYRNAVYNIVWAHNNVPTEAEWNKKSGYLRAEFRISPAIPEFSVVVLSFDSSPAEQGEEL
jgi:hypothetical protein